MMVRAAAGEGRDIVLNGDCRVEDLEKELSNESKTGDTERRKKTFFSLD